MDEIHQIDSSNLSILWQRIRTFVMALLTCKSDRSTTLSGYGITDAYTKTDIDAMLDEIELTPGPQGEKGDKGDKGDKGNTGATGIGIGLKDELYVTFEIERDVETNKNHIIRICDIDGVTENGFYILHTEQGADSILSVDVINDELMVQYVMVGGFVGINTDKFIRRIFSEGEWSEWGVYNICEDKQKVLYSGEIFTIKVGDTLIEMDEDKLIKLKNFLEE